MIDTPKPQPGTLAYTLCQFFVNHINWCEGYYYDTDEPKPDNKLYNWLYAHWLWPFKQNDCICCNTVRGVVYGGVVGYSMGVLL